MAVEPKELMEDWITTLDRENTIPWNPAGSPTCRIRLTIRLSRRSFRRSRCRGPWSLIRQLTTSRADTAWEMMVARATPATLIWNTMTNSRFSATLVTPAMAR